MYAHRPQRQTSPSRSAGGSRYAPSAPGLRSDSERERPELAAPDRDLSGSDFSGSDFSGSDFSGSDFSDFGLAMVQEASLDGLLDDELLHGDPLERAKAVSALSPQVDGALQVRIEEEVAASSRAETADWNSAFLALDADPKLGFTFPTAGPEADPSMAVQIGRPGERRRGQQSTHLEATGIHTLADYRAMLVQDFNFGGLVERLAGVPSLEGQDPEALRASGEAAFVQLSLARFHPGLTAEDPRTETTVAVAKNIWSYATCGTDVEGRSDISELQGLLYLFDAEIRASSDTNTTMTDGSSEQDWFVIPGTEEWDTPLKAKRGDGRHGTATVRTTRHLMAKLDTTPRLDGFDESYLLLDHTGSMGQDEYRHLSTLLDRGGLDGTVALAGFEQTISEVSRGRQLSQAEAQKHLMRPQGALEARGGRECTLKAARQWLEAIQGREVTGEERTVSRQMVIVTDAADNAFTTADLERVQELARELRMSIKVMYSYNSASPNRTELGGADEYVLVDVLQIDPAAIQASWKVNGGQLDWRQVGDSQNATPQRW